MMISYLHDELDRTDEETEELEDHVLLLLLHLVQAVLAATGDDLLLGKTDAGVRLEHLLGDDTAAVSVGLGLLLILVVDGVAIVGLEVFDEGINVLILLLVLDGLLNSLNRSGVLLVELAARDAGVQRRRCGSRLGHCW